MATNAEKQATVADVHQRAIELIYNGDNECGVKEVRNQLVTEFGQRLVTEAALDVQRYNSGE